MLHLFLGPDDYLKTEGAKHLIDTLVPPEERDFGLEILNATCNTCDDLLAAVDRAGEALYTPSFLGGNKVVWLQNCTFFPGTKSRCLEAEEAKAAAEKFFRGLIAEPLPPGHSLIITANSCPAVGASKDFLAWVKKNGAITTCGDELPPWKQAEATDALLSGLLPQVGLKFSRDAREAFTQRLAPDSRTILSELEKLKTYLGGETLVEASAVEAVTSGSAETPTTALTDAICARSAAAATKAIAQLRTDKNAAFPAAIGIINLLNTLVALRDAQERGWFNGKTLDLPPSHIPACLQRINYKHPAAANRYTLNELRAARHYAIQMRFKLVDSTAQDAWAIIEPAVLRIIARARR